MVVVFVVMPVFYFLHPCGGGGHVLEVEQAGIQKAVKIHVAVVALDYACLGLYGTYHGTHAGRFPGGYLADFVQQYDVAEFYLFYYQILDVVAVVVFAQAFTAAEFVAHAQGVHNSGYGVEPRDARFAVFTLHVRDGTDGLGYRRRLTYAAGLDNDIIE